MASLWLSPPKRIYLEEINLIHHTEALLRRITGHCHDPCLLDTFIAAVRYMEGGPKTPWWKFTAERKRTLAARDTSPKSSR